MSDVGDVDGKLKAPVRQAPRADRVIEVARVGGVHGHAELIAQVAPTRVRGEGRAHVRHDLLGLPEHGGGKLPRKPVGRHHRLHVEVELVRGAHAPLERHDRSAPARGVLSDAREHDVALHHAETRGARVLRNDEEVVADAHVERHHGAERPGRREAPEEGRHGACEHRAHHGTRRPAALLHDRDLDLVAVHGLTLPVAHELEVALRRLHVRGARSRHHERPRERAPALARPTRAAPAPAPVMRPAASHGPPSPEVLLAVSADQLIPCHTQGRPSHRVRDIRASLF